VLPSCKKAHDDLQKSKYGDADRIKCRVILRGGAGQTLDSFMAGSFPRHVAQMAGVLGLDGAKVLRENLVLCEKRYYWGGAMRGYKWFEVENTKRIAISTPSRVPSSEDIVIYTSKRVPGKKGEYRNYEYLGTVGEVEVWRYTDRID